MSNRVLVLRTVAADMRSYNDFQYPESGFVEAPDWDGGKDVCGGGLHGFLWGVGKGGLADWSESAKWLVLAVDPDDGLVEITADGGGKCKFRRGEVVYCGDREGAAAYLDAHGAADKPVVGAIRQGGDYSTLTGGDYSTLTGGDYSTLTGGDDSTLTGGYRSTLTGGYRSTLTGGDGSTLTGGDGSTLTWKIWDGQRWRLIVRYTDEGGIKANTPYRWDSEKGEAVEVKMEVNA